MSTTKISIIMLGIVIIVVGFLALDVFAWEKKGKVCHCQGKECKTLNIGIPAINKHLKKHDGDYRGKCKPQQTEDPKPTDEPKPTEEPEPSNDPSDETSEPGDQGPGGDCCAHDDDKHPDNQPKEEVVVELKADPVPVTEEQDFEEWFTNNPQAK